MVTMPQVVGMGWVLSNRGDRAALDIVDGTGPWSGHGPHYSRRTPGSRTFTGMGQDVVLVHPDGAVWAVVYAAAPFPKGGRTREPVWLWRNNMFRRMPTAPRASDLIRSATDLTYEYWRQKYGVLPEVRLRTEVKLSAVRSTNPGYCYLMAGWERGEVVRGKLYLYAPRR